MTTQAPQTPEQPEQRPTAQFGKSAGNFGSAFLDTMAAGVRHRWVVNAFALVIVLGIIGTCNRIPVTREGAHEVASVGKSLWSGLKNAVN